MPLQFHASGGTRARPRTCGSVGREEFWLLSARKNFLEHSASESELNATVLTWHLHFISDLRLFCPNAKTLNLFPPPHFQNPMGRTKKSAKKSKLSSDAALKSEGRRNNQRYVDDEESSYSSSFESSSEYGDSNSDVESFSDESSSRYGSYAEKGESSTKIVSGAKAPIKSKAKAAVSAEDVTVVRALSRHEHDALNNKQTKYRLFIEGSLENLKSAAGTDAEGNQKPLGIFLPTRSAPRLLCS